MPDTQRNTGALLGFRSFSFHNPPASPSLTQIQQQSLQTPLALLNHADLTPTKVWEMDFLSIPSLPEGHHNPWFHTHSSIFHCAFVLRTPCWDSCPDYLVKCSQAKQMLAFTDEESMLKEVRGPVQGQTHERVTDIARSRGSIPQSSQSS